MDHALAPTVVAAFAAVTSTDPTRPIMTFYDDATGERTELSGATMANWVAKTANLVVDGLGLGAGDTAAVVLPAHWQTAAILLGCWSAGLSVSLDGEGQHPVAFVTADRGVLGDRDVLADETYALSLAPLGLPFRPGPPPGTLDYIVEVRRYGDTFAKLASEASGSAAKLASEASGSAAKLAGIGPETVALASGQTHRDLVTAALACAMPAGARVLIDGDAVSSPVEWLVAPLVCGSSVVLCRNLDPSLVASRLTRERAVAYPPG
jgi:uncharacterized protein (TIGR03089 family)